MKKKNARTLKDPFFLLRHHNKVVFGVTILKENNSSYMWQLLECTVTKLCFCASKANIWTAVFSTQDVFVWGI